MFIGLGRRKVAPGGGRGILAESWIFGKSRRKAGNLLGASQKKGQKMEAGARGREPEQKFRGGQSVFI